MNTTNKKLIILVCKLVGLIMLFYIIGTFSDTLKPKKDVITSEEIRKMSDESFENLKPDQAETVVNPKS